MLDANNNPKKIDLSIRSQWILKFYNRMSKSDVEDIQDIPAEDLEFISSIPYEAMVTPFIKEKKNSGRRGLSAIFNVGEGYIRRITG